MSSDARTRASLTLNQKLRIKEFYSKNDSLTQNEIRDWVHREFGLLIGRSTVSKILLLDEIHTHNKDIKRQRTSRYPLLEQNLLHFLKTYPSDKDIDDDILLEKLLEFSKALNMDQNEIKNERKWLAAFKTRNGISFKYSSVPPHHSNNTTSSSPKVVPGLMDEDRVGTAQSGSVESRNGEVDSGVDVNLIQPRVDTARMEEDSISDIVSWFAPTDVFCMKEVKLLYNLPPNLELLNPSVPSPNKHKSFLTVVLCANTTGSEKLEPFIITKKTAFKAGCGQEFQPFIYTTKDARMTRLFFRKWLKTVNDQMAGRKVLLLVHKSPMYATLAYSNVVVKFLPTQLSGQHALGPMDCGIKQHFKLNYKIMYVQRLVDKLKDPSLKETLNIFTAIQLVKKAWTKVSSQAIKHSWLSTDIVRADLKCCPVIARDEHTAVKAQHSNSSDNDIPYENLDKLIMELGLEAPADAKTYVDIEADDECYAVFLDDEEEQQEQENLTDNTGWPGGRPGGKPGGSHPGSDPGHNPGVHNSLSSVGRIDDTEVGQRMRITHSRALRNLREIRKYMEMHGEVSSNKMRVINDLMKKCERRIVLSNGSREKPRDLGAGYGHGPGLCVRVGVDAADEDSSMNRERLSLEKEKARQEKEFHDKMLNFKKQEMAIMEHERELYRKEKGDMRQLIQTLTQQLVKTCPDSQSVATCATKTTGSSTGSDVVSSGTLDEAQVAEEDSDVVV